MKKKVLVATATTAFGELIQQTLQEERHFQVVLVNRGAEILTHIQEEPFVLIILDTNVTDIPLNDLCPALRKLQPALRLVIIPPDNDPSNPSLANLSMDGYLSKPFYTPDLLDTIDELIPVAEPVKTPSSLPQPVETSASIATTPAPVWLQDVNRAAQHLTRLSLESAAQAALIVRSDRLWAYAGHLEQGAAEELAEIVASRWAPGSDLARFIHLDATDGEYMLYATSLGGDMALALAFDVEMPFSKIRSQATNLARSLATQPPTTEPLPTSPPHEEASQTDRPATQAEYDEEDFPIDISSLKPLFDDVPPPTPSPVQLAAPTTPPATIETKQDQPSPLPDNGFSLEKSPAIRMETFPTVEQCEPPQPETPPLEEVTFMKEDEALSETRPHVVIDSDMGAGLQPISPAVCSLNYTCLLIPRLPKHHLTGDLADRLSEWVPQLCLAFGWRLEQLSVRPDYLQWTVNVPPSTSPSYLMRILRQHSSEHIFADFPALGRENPSGDFWAPGYLIMSSLQPPPAQIIKDFIKKTRRHQGVSKSKFTVA